jgi:hypothetical protein
MMVAMEQLFSRDEAWRRLRPLLAQFTTRGLHSEDCRILQDLHIGGDDAGEFLDEVHETFGTRFDGLVFSDYFPNLDETGSERWLRKLGFRDDRKVLTIGHLLDVIGRGAWFEPPPQDAPLPTGNRLRRHAIRGLVAGLLPLAYVLAAMGAGEALGFSPTVSFLLIGLPVAAVLAAVVWRRLPAN